MAATNRDPLLVRILIYFSPVGETEPKGGWTSNNNGRVHLDRQFVTAEVRS
jgi:hypothetical protein